MTETDIVIIGRGAQRPHLRGLPRDGRAARKSGRAPQGGGRRRRDRGIFIRVFRNSVAAYTVSLLNPRIISDLKLSDHGLRIVERRAQNFFCPPRTAAIS